MKHFLFLLITSISFWFRTHAQSPQGFNYQAVARNSGGTVITNQNIGFKINILQGSSTGSMVYSETHTTLSNANGLVNLTIGSGVVQSGTFNTINWAAGPYFLEINMDATGGSTYVLMGTQQLISVPYALYAEKSGNATPVPTISINSPNTVSNPAAGVYSLTVPASSLSIAGTSLSISNGNTVVLPSSPVYSAGNGIAINSGVIKTNILNTALSFSTAVSSNVRNAVVTSTEYLTIPTSGYYLLSYVGNGNNGNSYNKTAGQVYDLNSNTGLINLTQNPNSFINNVTAETYGKYEIMDLSANNIVLYIRLTQSFSVISYCNAGDQITVGAITFPSGTPSPATNWSLGPKRLEAVKLRD